MPHQPTTALLVNQLQPGYQYTFRVTVRNSAGSTVATYPYTLFSGDTGEMAQIIAISVIFILFAVRNASPFAIMGTVVSEPRQVMTRENVQVNYRVAFLMPKGEAFWTASANFSSYMPLWLRY